MTTWTSLYPNEILTRQDLEDNINNGTFGRKSYFDISGANANKTVTKNDIDAFIYFTPNSSYYGKSGTTEIAKQDISAGGGGGGPVTPDRYNLTQYVSCSATGTTTTANLGGGVAAPSVGNFVTLSGTGGCWIVSSIDQSTSVAYTINGNYGTDCACGYVVPNRYFLTRYSSCSPTSDTTTANLTAGLSVPAVNSFVNINGLSGCWKITSIDQSTAVSYTITNVYGTDCACSQPSISSTSSFTTFSTCLNVPSASQVMTVSGVNLTNSIVVTGDTLLQFSLTNNNDFASSVSITPTSGTVPSTNVYVRLTGGYVNSTGLSISITSTGASPISKTTGTAYTFAQPTVTSTTDGSRSGAGTVVLSATVSANSTADWYAQSSGGTALATGTLSFTTPSISQTTTYYVQARDTSGNGCVNTSRSAVTATVNAVTNPAPILDSSVFWGTLTQNSNGYFYYNNNNVHPVINTPNYVGFYPPYSTSTAPYWDMNSGSTSMSLTWNNGNGMENMGLANSYTLMFYGSLMHDGVNRKIFAKDSGKNPSNGWDIIWDAANSRFVFRYQGVTADSYIYYTSNPFSDINAINLYSFVFTVSSGSTTITLYVNDYSTGGYTTTVSYSFYWGTSGNTNNMKFGNGGSSDASPYKGLLKAVLMYNTNLSGSDISNIYSYLSTH